MIRAPGDPAIRLTIAAGARWLLRDILTDLRPARVLVVGSARALRTPDASAMLHGNYVEWFSGFAPNPSLEHVLAGSSMRIRLNPDLIVAIGGGSAIDTAKLVRLLPGDRGSALRLLTERRELSTEPNPPLVAIPTTAGSGSEVTRFATLYVDSVKMSLDDPVVAPQYALVDPELLRTCPTRLSYSCAFDTFCHAVESYWSKRSTPHSRMLAYDALRGVVDVLTHDLSVMGDEERARLAEAATHGGQAIDLTRTTSAHAFSYRLTARFNVPHGVACMLNLLWLIDYNLEHVASVDPTPIRESLRTLTAALRPSQQVANPSDAIRAMLSRSGFPDHLRCYGVSSGDVPDLVDAGLASSRSENNPVSIDREFAIERLSALL
jgi:alcohol dehydrogenase class IV